MFHFCSFFVSVSPLTSCTMDLCDLNPRRCFNGTCAVNQWMNATYCNCRQCYEGISCEIFIRKQREFNTEYIYFILYSIGLVLSVLNNGFCLELLIKCKLLRQTNGGIYLIAYCILSILASMLLVVHGAVQYFPNDLYNDTDAYKIFGCFVITVGYNMLVYLGLWFSAFVTFENALTLWVRELRAWEPLDNWPLIKWLIKYLSNHTSGNRWRSYITIVVTFVIAIGTSTPLVVYNCEWGKIPPLKRARGFITWFYITTAITIYVLSSILIVISLTNHIHRHRMDIKPRSYRQTFLILLSKHLFIFIAPIVYATCYIPYTIVINVKNSNNNPRRSYFQCGISTGEYIVKVFIEMLTGVPFVMTWFLYVYPSRVYKTEFYQTTFLGQYLKKRKIMVRDSRYRSTSAVSLHRSASTVQLVAESRV